MADKPIAPQFTDDLPSSAPPRVPVKSPAARPAAQPGTGAAVRPTEKKRRFIATLDTYVLIDLGILLAIGLMMVYSTTFDWSYQAYGNESTIFFQQVRNLII